MSVLLLGAVVWVPADPKHAACLQTDTVFVAFTVIGAKAAFAARFNDGGDQCSRCEAVVRIAGCTHSPCGRVVLRLKRGLRLGVLLARYVLGGETCGVSKMAKRYQSIKQDIAIAKRLADSVIRNDVLREQTGASCVDVLHHRALKAALLMAIFRLSESALFEELPRNLMFRWFLDLGIEESLSRPRLCDAWRHLHARGQARDFFERFARRAIDHGLLRREPSVLPIHLRQRGQWRADRLAAQA